MQNTFNPGYGDIIVTSNGTKFVCTDYETLWKNKGNVFTRQGPIVGSLLSGRGWQSWNTDGKPYGMDDKGYGQEYIIKEIIPQKKPRAHSELIKAWADGATIQKWCSEGWFDTSIPYFYAEDKYRIKPEEPKFISINGVKVPEPYRVHPKMHTTYWSIRLHGDELVYVSVWCGIEFDIKVFDSGLCFKTKEDAEAFANACIRAAKG